MNQEDKEEASEKREDSGSDDSVGGLLTTDITKEKIQKWKYWMPRLALVSFLAVLAIQGFVFRDQI